MTDKEKLEMAHAYIASRKEQADALELLQLRNLEELLEDHDASIRRSELQSDLEYRFRVPGMTPQYRGQRYVLYAIQLLKEDREEYQFGITKRLYPAIAKKYGTTSSRVERCIRHAVDVSWPKLTEEIKKEIFGEFNIAVKPTNSEYLLAMADYLQ